jgi:hypothetical protein
MEAVDVSFAKMKITDVIIQGDDSKPSYKYLPKEDITGLELAHLIHFFAVASVGMRHMIHYDYVEFLERHRLLRHFEEVLV